MKNTDKTITPAFEVTAASAIAEETDRRRPFIAPDVSDPVSVGSLTLAATANGQADGGAGPGADGEPFDANP